MPGWGLLLSPLRNSTTPPPGNQLRGKCSESPWGPCSRPWILDPVPWVRSRSGVVRRPCHDSGVVTPWGSLLLLGSTGILLAADPSSRGCQPLRFTHFLGGCASLMSFLPEKAGQSSGAGRACPAGLLRLRGGHCLCSWRLVLKASDCAGGGLLHLIACSMHTPDHHLWDCRPGRLLSWPRFGLHWEGLGGVRSVSEPSAAAVARSPLSSHVLPARSPGGSAGAPSIHVILNSEVVTHL